MITFGLLLREAGIDERDVLVVRHSPTMPKLKDLIERLAATADERFNAYQSVQGSKVAAALRRSRLLASFVRTTSDAAVFASLWRVGVDRRLQADDLGPGTPWPCCGRRGSP